ncbi:uncharacterized protein LOC110880296 [Helianthus annuus]|uniref:uncharacterized protein LOC110880296 n=1 Tax=Helianthus annuus TaxID=4232 RepID=UPI000B8FF2A7|nr:uncharacterized protein LOC110880296 [Helianthus annuus]
MELIDIRWCMARIIRRAQRFMEITGRQSISGPSTKLGFDKSKIEENSVKQKSRALAVIQDDEGFNWNDYIPDEEQIGSAFVDDISPVTFNREREIAHVRMNIIHRAYKEAVKAKRWDAEREREMKLIPTEEEDRLKIEAEEKAEKESKENSVKVVKEIIDVNVEMTTENLKKKADQVLMAKALEVDTKSAFESESSNKVSSVGHNVNAENEKLVLEDRKLTEAFEKLKRTIKDSDSRDFQTRQENIQLKTVIQEKEKQINNQLDEIANLKLHIEEVKIENERINLKLKSYHSASFVLQHIVPKPIGKNKDGEDVYQNGTGVWYHTVPPPMNNEFTKKHFGVEKELNMNAKGEVDNLPENIDVTFIETSDEDSVESEVVINVVENVLKTDSYSTVSNENDDCFLNNYLPNSKSKNNLKDEPTLVMYQVYGSDKLYPDEEFLIENVNVNKLEKVFKLVGIDVSEVDRLSSYKRFLNFQKDKYYYNKPKNPPRFQNNNQNRGYNGQWAGKQQKKRNFQKSKFVKKTTFVKSSSSMKDQESEIFSKLNEEFFANKASQT